MRNLSQEYSFRRSSVLLNLELESVGPKRLEVLHQNILLRRRQFEVLRNHQSRKMISNWLNLNYIQYIRGQNEIRHYGIYSTVRDENDWLWV